ncbi:MAG: hypothetical protein JO051_16360 [Acidobacteriaceae bacterium]|nr:hypothetical protein [Acidobacteriaceae bacterium]
MLRPAHIAAFLGFALSVCAAEFQTGQAARAVIGQSSFSGHESGISATALSLSNGRLYVADTSHRLLTFDLSQIPAAKDDFAGRQASGCSVCGFSPLAVLNQSVIPGISAVSVWGKSVAIADTPNRRVLVWRDASSQSALKGPDVILAGDIFAEPISVALDGQRLFVGDGTLHHVLVWNSLPQTENQPADVVLGQANFSDISAADSIIRPVAIESDGKNLFVADSVNRRILIFSPADVPLPANSLLNSASLSAGPLAPGTLVTISAAGLTQSSATNADDADQPLPKKLAGVEVVMDGTALPLLSVAPTEIRAQLPYDLANRSSASLYVRSEAEDGTVSISAPVAVTLLPASPGLFAFSGKEPRPGMTVHGASEPFAQGAPITSNSPAHPGEAITLWGAGLGALIAGSSNTSGVDLPVQIPVTAMVNGMPAEVLSATLPEGSIGIYEIRVQLPLNLPEKATTTLSISQDGHASNTVTIPVRAHSEP